MPNRLAQQTSPYLLQHADNPVDWYPWGEDALRLAREQDRPILLSVGYSACHWCHVMAHESFEDADIAATMNRHFVNIKVDREERPDIDQIYQTAHHMLTQRAGGWPLTMFLTPDQKPFFGGTYFPKTPRYNLPGFGDLLERVAATYREQGQAIAAQNAELVSLLETTVAQPPASAVPLVAEPVSAALAELKRMFDPAHGGLGGAPKFPHPAELDLALSRGVIEDDESARQIALFTLRKMAEGGIYDQLGGGFCRYSVDERWMIPHFEKMLYDNGPLLRLYTDAWLVTADELFRRVSRTDCDLGDARDAVARRRLLLLAGCRLRARGRQVLRVDSGGRCAGTRRRRVRGGWRPFRLEPAAQLRRGALAPICSAADRQGRGIARPLLAGGRGLGRARAQQAVLSPRAAGASRPRRENPDFLERVDDPRDGARRTRIRP